MRGDECGWESAVMLDVLGTGAGSFSLWWSDNIVEKVKEKVLVAQSCPTVCDPHGLYVACQFPLSMGFSRQECWSGLPFLFSRVSSQPRD